MSPKKMKVVFTLSVLLNLLLGGMMVGHHFHKAQWTSQFKEGLSPQGGEMVQAAFTNGRENFWAMMKEMKGTKNELMDVISAPTFDEAAFDAAAEKMKDSLDKLSDHRFSMLKKLVQELPQDDRAKFADKFVRLIQGFGKPHGRKGLGKDGEKRDAWMDKDHSKDDSKPEGEGEFPPLPAPVE